jgi:tight adherence protein C
MSSLYLLLLLSSTFGVIAVIGKSVTETAFTRRRAVRLLEQQVGVPVTNVREQELTGTFMDRSVVPFLTKISTLIRPKKSSGLRARTAQKLVLAGSPATWDADKVLAVKFGGGAVLALLGLVLGSGASLMSGALFGLLFGLIGFLAPDGLLNAKAKTRQEEIRKALPDSMDLLTVSVEAGLGFDAALAQVAQNVPGELSKEIVRMLQEIQLGVARIDALRDVAERTDVEDLRTFVLAMIQADIFGVSVAKVLRSQSKEIRTRRRQRAEGKAMQIPVKMLFPLIFCIMPALLVVLAGPAIIRIAQTFGS